MICILNVLGGRTRAQIYQIDVHVHYQRPSHSRHKCLLASLVYPSPSFLSRSVTVWRSHNVQRKYPIPFFPASSYRFIVLIKILPFSLMFDVCLSSLLSPCHRTLTISHWQRCLRQWRQDLGLPVGLDTFHVFKTYVLSFIRNSAIVWEQMPLISLIGDG